MRRGLLRGLIYAALSLALYPFAALAWHPVGWVVAGYVAFSLGLSAFVEWARRDDYAQAAAALSELSEGEQDEAVRAIWRGPLPVDPRVREATVALAGLQL